LPRSYTPKHLAEKILSSRSALEGERKHVTVLFADVKGSMDLSESIDPEDWPRIRERFFKILTEGVHRVEGTLNQYTGGGIMALFGAPIAHEDHARSVQRSRSRREPSQLLFLLPLGLVLLRRLGRGQANRSMIDHVAPAGAGLHNNFRSANVRGGWLTVGAGLRHFPVTDDRDARIAERHRLE
jgi:class 3 adenylate cyclase